MIDRLELAKRFVRELQSKRDDIIGALVYGSVARGDATDTSDIDLGIYIKEDKGEAPRNLAHWEEGVYIESGTHTTKGLGSLEEVMGSIINATHLNDALILYDPTGFFGRLQQQVRSVYMQRRWLRMRLKFALDACRTNLSKLRESTAAGDPAGTCGCVWWLSHMVPAVPLYLAGVTPSSTRKLELLARIDLGLRERVIEFECSLPLTATELTALRDTCRSYNALKDQKGTGGLPDYMIRKAESMASHGALNDAVDVLWTALLAGGQITAENAEEGHRLGQEWLLGVGWEGGDVVKGKLVDAESLVRHVETMAAAGAPEDVASP